MDKERSWVANYTRQLQHFTTGNSTGFYPLNWEFKTIINLIIDLLAFVLNLAVVVIFCKTPSVRTSFNYFLVNLCSANLMFTSVLHIVNTVNYFFPNPYPPAAFCAIVRYLSHIGGASLNNAHLIIALNRLWAVMWPTSYRRFHLSRNARRPVLICAGMWLYINAWTLPRVLVDALHTRKIPESPPCSTRVIGSPLFNISTTIVLYDLPILVI